MIWILWAFVILAFVWILFYKSPKSVVRVGCWLTGWGEGRIEMQKVHADSYARMVATRHLDKPPSPDQPEQYVDELFDRLQVRVDQCIYQTPMSAVDEYVHNIRRANAVEPQPTNECPEERQQQNEILHGMP